MKQLFLLTILLTTVLNLSSQSDTQPLRSQQAKDITLDAIWSGAFRTDRMNALNSMNGDFYSLLNYDRATATISIDKYSYNTLEKVATIVTNKDLDGINNFSSYEFNADETKLLLGTDYKKVYRHSYKATYYIYDVINKTTTLVGEDIQEPTFSPDSKKVAYAKDNNLFIKNMTTNAVTQITADGKKNHIINGTTDWVYEEEFAFVKAFEWNAASTKIAFLRFDETNVPEFSMDVMGKALYPSQHVFKYPKAGEKNAVVNLHIYDLKDNNTTPVTIGEYEYIPRIQWTNRSNTLCVTTLNRHQNNLNLYFVNAKTNTATVVLNETDNAYVDIQDNLTFLDDNSFIWTSEKDGFNHIYHYSESGKLINQVTKGPWEVTAYYGYNKTNKRIYYQSVENGSINRGVYAIGLNGRKKQLLSKKDGTNSAAFSKNLQYFINTHSSATTPPSYHLYNAKGKQLQKIKDNSDLKNELASYTISPKEFSTITINGNNLNMWLLKPLNFDPSKTYPLLLFQYSGPGSQKVSNSWHRANDYWHNMLAQKGMIIACVDGRGTGYKGRDFKKVTQKELGKYEVEDQIAVAKALAKRPYIDQNNIGIWGWSYGGFMSTNCLLKGNDIFTTAIAVAPVTSWRFYDTVYTERYMTTPQENPSGYDDNSPINYAHKLNGNYLLVHGSGDDNVHLQNTTRMVDALIEANKPFDLFIYPDRAHSIYKGKNTRLHLYTKMTDFLLKSLKINKN